MTQVNMATATAAAGAGCGRTAAGATHPCRMPLVNSPRYTLPLVLVYWPMPCANPVSNSPSYRSPRSAFWMPPPRPFPNTSTPLLWGMLFSIRPSYLQANKIAEDIPSCGDQSGRATHCSRGAIIIGKALPFQRIAHKRRIRVVAPGKPPASRVHHVCQRESGRRRQGGRRRFRQVWTFRPASTGCPVVQV